MSKTYRKYKLYSILLVFILLCACTPSIQQENTSSLTTPTPTTSVSSLSTKIESPDVSQTLLTPTEVTQIQTDTPKLDKSVQIDEPLQVIVFDVGQADCVLVKVGEHAMLIDAGDTGQDNLILGYLADNGVTKLDYRQ